MTDKIDSDSHLIRIRRALNHFNYQDEIFEYCRSKSFKERFFFARKKIFEGVLNTHGFDPMEFCRKVNAKGI